jgi:hypothetical protein
MNSKVNAEHVRHVNSHHRLWSFFDWPNLTSKLFSERIEGSQLALGCVSAMGQRENRNNSSRLADLQHQL